MVLKSQAMTVQIMKELPSIKNTSEVISEQVLSWRKWIEAQRLQSHARQPKRQNEFDILSKTKYKRESDQYIAEQIGTLQERYNQAIRRHLVQQRQWGWQAHRCKTYKVI